MKKYNTTKYLKKLWNHKIEVSRNGYVKDSDGISRKHFAIVHSDVICHLSVKSSTNPNTKNETGGEIKRYPTLFCIDVLDIRKGDLIKINIDGFMYKGVAMQPMKYIGSHQEIILEELLTND